MATVPHDVIEALKVMPDNNGKAEVEARVSPVSASRGTGKPIHARLTVPAELLDDKEALERAILDCARKS